MWMQPHLVILDEPTNYLDRESLGALADAIRGSTSLTTLLVGNNRIRDEGVKAIVNALRDDRELKCLGLQNNEIGIKTTTPQSGERRHADAKGIAAGQTNSPPAHIQAEDRTGMRPHQRRSPRLGVGRGVPWGRKRPRT